MKKIVFMFLVCILFLLITNFGYSEEREASCSERYFALEYSFSEFHPFSLGLKLGTEDFYGTLIIGINPFNDFTSKPVAIGMGVGSIFRINNSFFINPEIYEITSIFFGMPSPNFVGLVPYFGYNINKNFSIRLGPSITWVRGNKLVKTDSLPFFKVELTENLEKPLYKISEIIINDNNSIVFGFRAALRFKF